MPTAMSSMFKSATGFIQARVWPQWEALDDRLGPIFTSKFVKMANRSILKNFLDGKSERQL
jgi:hypothetical protein